MYDRRDIRRDVDVNINHNISTSDGRKSINYVSKIENIQMRPVAPPFRRPANADYYDIETRRQSVMKQFLFFRTPRDIIKGGPEYV